MLRLLSNSIDYSVLKNKIIIPHSINHSAFGLPFYKVFEPREADLGIFSNIDNTNSCSEFHVDLPIGTEKKTHLVKLGDIRLGWSGEPQYDGTKQNTSYYHLKLGSTSYESYQLCIKGSSDEDLVQITTGEFADTKGYKISDSFIKYLKVTTEVSSYILSRKEIDFGEYIGVHLRYSNDKRARIDDVAERVKTSMSVHRTNKIFLATDSLSGYNAISSMIPEAKILTLAKLVDLDSLGAPNLHGLSESQLADNLGISKLDQIGLAIADLWSLLQTKDFIGSNSEFSRLATRLRSHQEKLLIASFFHAIS